MNASPLVSIPWVGAAIRNSSSWPASKNRGPPAGQANLSLVRGLKPFRRLSCRWRVEDPLLVFFFALTLPPLLLLVVPLADTKLKNTHSSRNPSRNCPTNLCRHCRATSQKNYTVTFMVKVVAVRYVTDIVFEEIKCL